MEKSDHTLDDPSSLVIAAKNGEEHAFGVLVARHWLTIHAIAYATVRDPDAADDIAQEAFLVAWTQLAQLHKPESFLMWLRKITRNLARNSIRSSAYRRQLRERYAAQLAAESDSATPESRAVTEERNADLDAALEHLSPRVREVVSLHYLHEQSTLEIACALDITASAVKKRLERGRKELRSTLEARWKRDRHSISPPADAKAMAQKIMSALVLGPAVPAIGQSASGAGASLLLDHLSHSGAAALKPLITGGMIMSAKQATSIVTAIVVFAAAGYMLINQGESSSPLAVQESEPQRQADLNREPDPDTTTLVASTSLDSPPDPIATNIQTQPSSEDDDALSVQTPQPDAPETEPSPEPATIDGYVVDQWGAPIAGATVVAVATGRVFASSTSGDRFFRLNGWRELEHHHLTISREDGTFRFNQIARPGRTTLHASTADSSGSTSVSIAEGEERTQIKIVVREGVALWGRLLTPDRRPVPGARLDTLAFISGTSARGGSFGYAITEDDGAFQLLYEREGLATLRVLDSDGVEQLFVGIPVGSEAVQDLILEEPASLAGTITYSDGQPAQGAEFVLFSTVMMISESSTGSGGSRVTTNGSVYKTLVDPKGRYSISDVGASGDYQVVIRTSSARELTEAFNLPAFYPGEDRVWDHVIQNELTVRGHVLARTGAGPVPAEVYAMRDGERIGMNRALTGPDGSFTLRFPGAPGHYTIAPTHQFVPLQHRDRKYDVDVDISPGEAPEIILRLDDPYTINLRAADVHGDAIPNADVSLTWEVESASWGHGTVAQTDDDGRYTWSGFGPIGSFKLQISATGYTPTRTEPYYGQPGAEFPEETVILYEPAILEGIALDYAGDPIAFDYLRVSGYIDGERYGTAQVPTNGNGYFTSDVVPATTVTLRIRRNPAGLRPADAWKSGAIEFFHDYIVDLGEITLIPE